MLGLLEESLQSCLPVDPWRPAGVALSTAGRACAMWPPVKADLKVGLAASALDFETSVSV